MIRRLLSTLTLVAMTIVWLPGPASAAEYTIVPTLPLQGDHVDTARPTIAFQIHSADATDSVPQSAVHLFIDDQDMTPGLQVEGANLAFVPPTPLALGNHTVRVTVDDGRGGSIGYNWNFTIDADNEQPSSDQLQQYGNSTPYDTVVPTGDQFGYGDDAGFFFNGDPGGFGYLSFPGYPGYYPLSPVLGYPNLYYAGFPVPYGFNYNGPPVVTFTNPGGAVSQFSPVHHINFVPVGAPSNRRFITGGRPWSQPPAGHALGVTPTAGSVTNAEAPRRFNTPWRGFAGQHPAAGTQTTINTQATVNVPSGQGYYTRTNTYIPPSAARITEPVSTGPASGHSFTWGPRGNVPGAPVTSNTPNTPVRSFSAAPPTRTFSAAPPTRTFSAPAVTRVSAPAPAFHSSGGGGAANVRR